MHILVFQHIDCEHPGIFRQHMRQAGVEWQAVQLDKGEKIPPLEGYDALWVMGGPMDVWDTDQQPWLIEEKKAIARWVEQLGKPYFGLCLGHQLLADALGGSCALLEQPEVGILDIQLNQQGLNDPIFQNIPTTCKALQWHSVEVSQPPAGANVLANSPACHCQAMRVNNNAYGLQYHVELEANTISNWEQIPAYAQALENTLGQGALDKLNQDAQPHYSDMAANAQQLFDNFLQIAHR